MRISLSSSSLLLFYLSTLFALNAALSESVYAGDRGYSITFSAYDSPYYSHYSYHSTKICPPSPPSSHVEFYYPPYIYGPATVYIYSDSPRPYSYHSHGHG